jgi:hypothetical protein
MQNRQMNAKSTDELKAECESAEERYRSALKAKRAAAAEATEALRAATVARQRLLRADAREELGAQGEGDGGNG